MQPWEKYQTPVAIEEGPWSKYQQGSVATQEQPDSIQKNMSEGQNPLEATGKFMSEHPVKTMFQGPTETLTGETAQTKLLRNQKYQTLPGRDLPVVGGPIKGAEIAFNTFKDMPASAVGFAADQLSPANILTAGVTKIPGVKEAGQALAKTAPVKAVGEFLTKERNLPIGDKHTDNRIFDLYNKAIGSKIKNAGSDINKFKNDRVSAVKTIDENMGDIKLPDKDTGELVSRTPETRMDLLQAHNQAKKSIWKKYSQLSGDATESGAVMDIKPIADKALKDTLDSIGEDAIKANPGLRSSLVREYNNVLQIGKTNPTKAEAYMKSLNNELINFRKNGQAVDYSVLDFKNKLINHLNDATESTIENTLEKSGYRALRKQYAALKSSEKEILASANKQLREEGGKGGFAHPIINLWSLEELIQGGAKMVATGGTHGGGDILRGGLIKGSSKVLDYFNNPDRKIRKMFELIAKQREINAAKPVSVNAELVNPKSVIPQGQRALPNPNIPSPTARNGVNIQGELPSPNKVGSNPIITPASESSKAPKLIGTDNVYGDGFVMGKNPIIKKPNKYIKEYDMEDFNNMYEWESAQEKGGNIKMGGAQGSESKQLWKQKSGHSKVVQDIGPAKAKKIMDKVANGEDLTTGQQMALKRMMHEWNTKTKPMLESKKIKYVDSGQAEWTD